MRKKKIEEEGSITILKKYWRVTKTKRQLPRSECNKAQKSINRKGVDKQ